MSASLKHFVLEVKEGKKPEFSFIYMPISLWAPENKIADDLLVISELIKEFQEFGGKCGGIIIGGKEREG